MALLHRNIQGLFPTTPTQPAAPPPAPAPGNPSPYRAIFNYQPQSQASSDIMNPDEAIGTPNRGRGTYLNPNDPNAFSNLSSAERDALIASGAVRSTAGMYGGDGGDTGADMGYIIDYDKLPQAMAPDGKTPVNVASLTPTNNTGSNLLNPAQRWQDQNYGNVAMSQNNSGYKKDIWDTLYNVLPSAFMAGMGGMALAGAGGGLLGPNSMMKVPQLAQSVGQGGFNPMNFLSNAAMGYFHVPQIARPFLQYGVNEFSHGGKG